MDRYFIKSYFRGGRTRVYEPVHSMEQRVFVRVDPDNKDQVQVWTDMLHPVNECVFRKDGTLVSKTPVYPGPEKYASESNFRKGLRMPVTKVDDSRTPYFTAYAKKDFYFSNKK